MKALNRFLQVSIFFVTFIQLEASCESPFKKLRYTEDISISESPCAAVELFSTLSPESSEFQNFIAIQKEKSKMDLAKDKMSHISYRLDGKCLVSCLEPIDSNLLGIVDPQIFYFVQYFHQFRIDVNNLTESDITLVDAWDMSQRLCNLKDIDSNIKKNISNEPYKAEIFKMLSDDFSAIKYDLRFHGLLRGENILNKDLNECTKKIFDDIYHLQSDMMKGQKKLSKLGYQLNKLLKIKLPSDNDIQSIINNKLKYLKAGLIVYRQREESVNPVITRIIFSDAEKLAQDIICRDIECADKQARKNDFIKRYHKLLREYKAAHFDGRHKFYANFSLKLIRNLLANYNDDL